MYMSMCNISDSGRRNRLNLRYIWRTHHILCGQEMIWSRRRLDAIEMDTKLVKRCELQVFNLDRILSCGAGDSRRPQDTGENVIVTLKIYAVERKNGKHILKST